MEPLPPRAPPPEFSDAGSEEEMMDDALRKAKLAKLIEIEGYDSFEEFAGGRFLGCGVPCHLHERRVRLHLRDGA